MVAGPYDCEHGGGKGPFEGAIRIDIQSHFKAADTRLHHTRLSEKRGAVDGIAQARSNLEFGLSHDTPGIDCHPTGIFIEEHVVMVKVAMQQSDVALCRTQLAEQRVRVIDIVLGNEPAAAGAELLELRFDLNNRFGIAD